MATAADYLPARDGISQSLYTEFAMCRVRGRLAVNRWGLPSKARSTWFGSRVHAVLDKMYSSSDVPTEAVIVDWVEAECVKARDEGTRAAIAEQDMELHAARAEALLLAYAEVHASEWRANKYEKPEQAFDIPWRGYRLRGKIDGVYRAKDKTLWLMEHKTKGRIDVEYLSQHLAFDFQNMLYVLAYTEERGEQPRGVLYNILRTPEHKPSAKTAETLAAFRKRLRAEILKDPEHFFLRYELIYTKKNLAEFARELEAQLADVNAVMLGTAPTYRNSHACLTPFPCQFLQACSSGHMEGYEQKAQLFTELIEEAK